MAEVQQDMQFHQLVQQALRAIDQQEAQMHGSVPARMTGEVSPVKALVDAVLSEAADEGASDIHVEPQASSVRIRVRIDGLLQRRHELPKRVYAVFLSCIKVLAKMDVSKTREPQDGRFTFA
ncbi:ATPase, T2SS/T4P/T4SS family, partial [uncultured Selenomonas sp.]